MNPTRLSRIMMAQILALFVLGFIFPNPHPHFWWQKIPAFDIFFGFLVSILLIVFAKWLAHNWLLKDKDYYNHD
ncbi:MAG: hypothetical protein DRH03_05440 [Deltaproteobacteria bacterium]|nr:MAG: hypothetical protein DRH03_05440 [Deltaproteobacteria bacterium]